MSAVAPGVSGSALSSSGKALKYSSSAEYVKALVPRVVGMPWSAPLFDDRTPVANPDVFCVSIEAHEDSPRRCQCYTEQVTRLSIPLDRCMEIARSGVYNPFRQPLQLQAQQQQQPAQQSPSPALPNAEQASHSEIAGTSSSDGSLQVPHGAGSFRGH